MIVKYIKQMLIIFGISYLGDVIHGLIPLPVPASIYGMALLFAALASGVVKVEDVKECSGFLLGIMPLLFIPAGVRLIGAWEELAPMLLPVAVITVVTTVLVMGVSGRVTQAILTQSGKEGGAGADMSMAAETDDGKHSGKGAQP